MTSTQQALAGACCVASAVLALLAPGILHHPSARNDAATLASRTASAGPRAVTTAAAAHQGASESGIRGIPVGQTSTVTAPPQTPAPVSNLSLVSNTWTAATIAWSGTTSRYRVRVDGQVVREGAGASITVRWPSDGSNLLVQVAALDTHGRLSEWRSLVVVPVRSSSRSQGSSQHSTTSPTSNAGQGSTAPTSKASTSTASSAPPNASASTAPSTAPTASASTGRSGTGGEASSTTPSQDAPNAQTNSSSGNDSGTSTGTRGDATTTATATPVTNPAN